MPRLVAPTTALHASFLASHREWEGGHQPGSGLTSDHDVESAEGFAAFVDELTAYEHTVKDEGYVTCTFRWVVEDDDAGEPQNLGSIALRHELNDYLADRGGHIGYGIRPSARRRGLASWALGAILPLARERGMGRVLVTCDDTNEGSWRTIEANGGVLEDVRTDDEGTRYRRYWIDTSSANPAAAAD